MTDLFEETRLNEGGPEPIRPGDTIQAKSNDELAEELAQHLDDVGISLPSQFDAGRNEHVRELMASLSPFRTDGHPLNENRGRMNRILVLLLELRGRKLRG